MTFTPSAHRIAPTAKVEAFAELLAEGKGMSPQQVPPACLSSTLAPPAGRPGETSATPTPEQFRKVGFTANAVNFPLSPTGQAIIAEHNGVTVDYLPEACRYSSNAHMHRWIEALGEAKAAGLPYRDPDGRLWTPARLCIDWERAA
jgi:hypothetical protein